MRKTILVLLGVLAVSLFIAGCTEPQNVKVVDDKGNVVGEAVRYSAGSYKVSGRCVPKTVAQACPDAIETAAAGSVCGNVDDGCGGTVYCGQCDNEQGLTGLTCMENKCVKKDGALLTAMPNQPVMAGSSCTDSDGGVKPLAKGTVTSGSASLTDYCIDNMELVEFSCSSGKAVWTMTNCQGIGSPCMDGACKPALN